MPALFCDKIGQTSWFPVDNVHKLWIKLLNKYQVNKDVMANANKKLGVKMKEILLIKNGELALKGLNRNNFEDILIKNLTICKQHDKTRQKSVIFIDILRKN